MRNGGIGRQRCRAIGVRKKECGILEGRKDSSHRSSKDKHRARNSGHEEDASDEQKQWTGGARRREK